MKHLTELLAHIGVPFLAVITILLFRAPTRAALTLRVNCNEIALEFAILGIGATGGVFLDPNISGAFHGDSGVYGILVVVLEMFFAPLIVFRGSHVPAMPPPVPPAPGIRDLFQGFFDLLLGFAPIMITGGVVFLPK
jgi:hypothetical protein